MFHVEHCMAHAVFHVEHSACPWRHLPGLGAERAEGWNGPDRPAARLEGEGPALRQDCYHTVRTGYIRIRRSRVTIAMPPKIA